MKEYELWLDESGEFKNDKTKVKRRLNPSLVGGVLFEKKEFSGNQAASLIGDKVIHSNEEDKNNVFEKFRGIAEKNVTLIEISNEECISVIDSNLTYQNIMAEGLIQIITKLREKNGNHNYKLDILIAQRGDCTSENKNNKVVSVQQYVDRISERMILEGYENNIPESCWSIQIADAKKDPRLMVADIICNSFLTRNTKFKGDQRDYINTIREDKNRTWKFSVFESSLGKSMKRLLLEGRLGEAVILLCQSKNEQYIAEKFEGISDYMKNMEYEDMHLQFQIISTRVSYYIKIEREYADCLKLLDNMIQYLVPVLKNLPQSWGTEMANIIELDLHIQKYTIYTHQGDLEKTKECEKLCEKLFSAKGKMNIESLEYLLMYTNRKITNQINLFDFERALEESNKLVERCEAIKEAISLSEEGITFDELGKALGTRAQVHMFMIRKNSDSYQLAENDVQNAIREFKTESDIQRQKIYLAQIYTEAGQYEKALEALCGSEHDIKQWIANAEYNIFLICAYVRLMAEGKRNGWNKADVMYDELNKTQIITNLKAEQNDNHPREVIFWKMGSYYAHCTKSQKAALDVFGEAIKCYNPESLTINVIVFAAELERYAFALRENLSERKIFLKQLIKHHEMFEGENVPETIRRLYDDIDFKKEDWHYFDQLSRNITY